MQEAVEKVRSGKGPILIEAKTYRIFGHSSADAGKYRDKKEVEEWKAKDPIKKFQTYLLNNKVFTADELKELDEASVKRVEEATEFAVNSEMPPLETALTDVYAD
jgi:pyruvate dehydrogenase E1 component alpha subunit